jgi:SPP1 family predicted phage head-tail adaptor
MRAGNLDRSIIIQAKTPTQNEFGEPVDVWAKIHTADTIPAAVRPLRGSESFTARQVVGKAVVTFRIRYRADVTTLNRIVYNGRDHDIHDVREVGRREGLEIDASARSE